MHHDTKMYQVSSIVIHLLSTFSISIIDSWYIWSVSVSQISEITDTLILIHLLPEIALNFSFSSFALQIPVLCARSTPKISWSYELSGTVLLFKCILCTNACFCEQYRFHNILCVSSDIHFVFMWSISKVSIINMMLCICISIMILYESIMIHHRSIIASTGWQQVYDVQESYTGAMSQAATQ